MLIGLLFNYNSYFVNGLEAEVKNRLLNVSFSVFIRTFAN